MEMKPGAVQIKGMNDLGVAILSLVLGFTFISTLGYALMVHVTFKQRKERREKEEKEITKQREERLQHATKNVIQRSRTTARISCADLPPSMVQA